MTPPHCHPDKTGVNVSWNNVTSLNLIIRIHVICKIAWKHHRKLKLDSCLSLDFSMIISLTIMIPHFGMFCQFWLNFLYKLLEYPLFAVYYYTPILQKTQTFLKLGTREYFLSLPFRFHSGVVHYISFSIIDVSYFFTKSSEIFYFVFNFTSMSWKPCWGRRKITRML